MENLDVTSHMPLQVKRKSIEDSDIRWHMPLQVKMVSTEDPDSGWHMPNFVFKTFSNIWSHKPMFSNKKKNKNKKNGCHNVL